MPDAARKGSELGGYRIEERTGGDAVGTVYRAVETSSGRVVALRLIAARLANNPGFGERFQRELRVLAGLGHPHLLHVYETGEEPREHEDDPVVLWAASQPLPGPDLASIVAREGKLSPARAARLVAQAAEALEAAHARGVLHRGIEPASIVVANDGEERAYLTGFGVVDDGALEGGTGDINRSAYPPSPDYVAPEQISGRGVDRRADVYALGGALFYALTGRPPFQGASIEETLEGHLKGRVPVLTQVVPAIPETLNGVVARALAKDPSERYESAAELAKDVIRRSGARRSDAQAWSAPAQPAPSPASAAAPAAAAAPPPDTDEPALPPRPTREADPEVPDKQRVIAAWAEAVTSGGRLWSPSAAGSGVPAASSAAAPPPGEERLSGPGDFSAFEAARRRRAAELAREEEPVQEADAAPSEEPSVPEDEELRATVVPGDGAVAEEPPPEDPVEPEAERLAAEEEHAAAEPPADEPPADEPSEEGPPQEEAPLEGAAATSAEAEPATQPEASRREPQMIQLPASSERRRRFPTRSALLGLAAAAVIAVLVVLGIALAGGGDDEPERASSPPPAEPEPQRDERPADREEEPQQREDKPADEPREEPASQPTGQVISWPDREGYTAVAYANPSDRDQARARARRAARAGFDAGVLRSDDYPSLQGGVWVTFAGVYGSEAEAQRAADRLRREGVATQPYVRFIGQSAQ